jgi:hypothetical protein
MLETFVESEEDYNAFFRPAVLDSLRATLRFYNLQSAAQIYYNGENEVAKLVGNNMGDGDRAAFYTDGIFRNKIFVTTEVEAHEFNSGFSNQRRMQTEMSVWSDDGALPLMLTPSFEGRKITVNVTANFNSRTPAQQFVNRINRLQANQVGAYNFSATVHLLMNPTIVEFFKEIHKLLAKNDPTFPALEDWFEKGCQAPMTIISNVANQMRRNVFPMRLDNIGIYFNEPRTALSRRAEIFGKYEVTLSYSFFFQEFIGWELIYPLMVYQDEIPAVYIPRVQTKYKEEFNRRVAPEVAFARDISFPDRAIQGPYYVKLPDHDPWVWPAQSWLQPVVQARLTVAAEEQQVLCNIFDDLPSFQWNPQVKAYMCRRHEWVFGNHHSPFLIQVYSNDQRVSPTDLQMDDKGSITLLRAPNLKNTYRVVVLLDWAIRDYADAFWDDLREHRDEWGLVESIFPNYDWGQFDDDWINHLYEVRRDIAKGFGRGQPAFNTYTMNADLNAFVLIEEVKHAR